MQNKPTHESIEWASPTHQRTPEETLFALQWCAEQGATISFQHAHVWAKLPGQNRWTVAYDLADAVKALAKQQAVMKLRERLAQS